MLWSAAAGRRFAQNDGKENVSYDTENERAHVRTRGSETQRNCGENGGVAKRREERVTKMAGRTSGENGGRSVWPCLARLGSALGSALGTCNMQAHAMAMVSYDTSSASHRHRCIDASIIDSSERAGSIDDCR